MAFSGLSRNRVAEGDTTNGQTDRWRKEEERRRLESCELVTFVIEFSHPAFSMLPPSFLSLPCFYSVLSGLSSSPSFSLCLLSSVRSLAHSLIATVSRDFPSFCLMDRTPEPPSPRCRPFIPASVRPRRLSSVPFEFLLVSQVMSLK